MKTIAKLVVLALLVLAIAGAVIACSGAQATDTSQGGSSTTVITQAPDVGTSTTVHIFREVPDIRDPGL